VLYFKKLENGDEQPVVRIIDSHSHDKKANLRGLCGTTYGTKIYSYPRELEDENLSAEGCDLNATGLTFIYLLLATTEIDENDSEFGKLKTEVRELRKNAWGSKGKHHSLLKGIDKIIVYCDNNNNNNDDNKSSAALKQCWETIKRMIQPKRHYTISRALSKFENIRAQLKRNLDECDQEEEIEVKVKIDGKESEITPLLGLQNH